MQLRAMNLLLVGVIVLLLYLLCGCATIWENPYKGPSEFARDKYICYQQSRTGGGWWASGSWQWVAA